MIKPIPQPTLEDQLRRSIDLVGPSLIPIPRYKKEDEDPAPDIREVVQNAALRLKIVRLSAASMEFSKAEKEAREAKDAINTELKALMSTLPEKRFVADGNLLTYYSMTRNTLNRDKLIDAGVKPSVLAQCTDTSVSYALKITPQ